MNPASWPRVSWSLVHPGDLVYAADQHVWEVTGRDGKLVIMRREGRHPIGRVDPPGDVPCMRGAEWRAIVEAVGNLRAGGFTVDHLGTSQIRDVAAGAPDG